MGTLNIKARYAIKKENDIITFQIDRDETFALVTKNINGKTKSYFTKVSKARETYQEYLKKGYTK